MKRSLKDLTVNELKKEFEKVQHIAKFYLDGEEIDEIVIMIDDAIRISEQQLKDEKNKTLGYLLELPSIIDVPYIFDIIQELKDE